MRHREKQMGTPIQLITAEKQNDLKEKKSELIIKTLKVLPNSHPFLKNEELPLWVSSQSMFSEVKNFCQFTAKALVSRMRTAVCVLCLVLSRVRLFVTPWTVARQDPLSMEFSRQE